MVAAHFVAVTSAVAALLTMGTSVGAAAETTERGHWMLDEIGSSIALDSSVYANHGINHNVVGDGKGYTFNGVDSRVVVPDGSVGPHSLDPEGADFSFGVTLSMTEPPGFGETYDALRKGLVSTPGGNYKLEIKHAKGRAIAQCVVKDTAKVTASIKSQPTVKGNLADGRIHTVTCIKTSTGVTVQVDALPPKTKTVPMLGNVSNSADFALGAKAETTATTGFDWFAGKLYDAWVAVTAPAPANTAPVVDVAGVTGGASYNKGAVPVATCQVTDAEDGNSSFPATLSAISGVYASDGIGSQTASCSYTDVNNGGGLTASASVTYGVADPSAPVITYTLTPAAPTGDSDWYTGDVSLTWSVSEPQSPSSLQKTGCVDQNITADQDVTAYSCSATSAGGSAAEQSVTIARDGTAPTISSSLSGGAKNGNGWYNQTVTVGFACNDGLSGILSCTADTTLGEGASQSVTGTATDVAGNTTSTTVSDIDIDLTNPSTPTFDGGPAPGSSFYFGNDPAAPTCSSSDALSGLESCVVTGGGSSVGPQSYTATATDYAGNTSTATLHYTVLA